jgi:ribose/xylose/arabinose/galactoside ABC-type transport system permease subunit
MKNSITTGVGAGFLGSLCCTIPVLLVAIGIGSIGFALAFTKYRPFFITLGVIFIIFSLYRQIKKEHGVCNRKTIKENISTIIIAIITAIIVWALLIYVIAPLLAKLFYG